MNSIKFFPRFKDEGEVMARFGNALLIRFLDGKLELSGGSNEDRATAREWMSMFWHEAVLSEPCARTAGGQSAKI
jgi:hypothetical protein